MADDTMDLEEMNDGAPAKDAEAAEAAENAEGEAGQSLAIDLPDDMDDDGSIARELDAVYNIPVQVSAVLGRATLEVSQLLKLGRGAVVELDRKVGEAIDIYVNNRLVARGEVVVVDERLGVTMTEIIKSARK